MTDDAASRDEQQRGLRAAPPAFIALVLSVVTITAACAVVQLAWVGEVRRRDWLVLLLLLALAVAFEAGSTRIARLQWRLSSELKRDMGSVWSVAAVIALPSAATVILVVVLLTHLWWRQQRPSGQLPHRAVFAGSTIVAGSLAAGYATRAVESACAGLPWALSYSLAVLVGIVVLTGINRVLITLALVILGARNGLLGTADENLTEFSTLCLGGLVAIAAIHEPWLCVLTILPMAMLQRGAFVRELETAAVTDTKTGLINAVGWEHIAQRELGRARRERYDVSVLIADIDHFKRVNDQHGHIVGDQVLRGLARTLTAALREYDTVGRFGGEEFVVVLPDTGDLAAVEIAERIRERVNAVSIASVSGTDDERLLSVSVGVATLRASEVDGADLTSMLIAADRALYRAKDAGRNRVCLADPDEPSVQHA